MVDDQQMQHVAGLDDQERAALAKLATWAGTSVVASALGLEREVLDRLEAQGLVMRVRGMGPARVAWSITRAGMRAVKEEAR